MPCVPRIREGSAVVAFMAHAAAVRILLLERRRMMGRGGRAVIAAELVGVGCLVV